MLIVYQKQIDLQMDPNIQDNQLLLWTLLSGQTQPKALVLDSEIKGSSPTGWREI